MCLPVIIFFGLHPVAVRVQIRLFLVSSIVRLHLSMMLYFDRLL